MDTGNDTDREARKGKERGREGRRQRENWESMVSENPGKDGDLLFNGSRDSVSSEEKIWNKIVVIV